MTDKNHRKTKDDAAHKLIVDHSGVAWILNVMRKFVTTSPRIQRVGCQILSHMLDFGGETVKRKMKQSNVASLVTKALEQFHNEGEWRQMYSGNSLYQYGGKNIYCIMRR